MRCHIKSHAARTVAATSTPLCSKNRLSSAAKMQLMRSFGISFKPNFAVCVASGKAKCISAAPCRSRNTGDAFCSAKRPGGSGIAKGRINPIVSPAIPIKRIANVISHNRIQLSFNHLKLLEIYRRKTGKFRLENSANSVRIVTVCKNN
jgi:hypothetical protein